MNATDSIDLVIPVYNPPVGWAKQCAQHHQQLETILGKSVQLILVDDGSQHAEELSLVEAHIPGIRLIRNPHNAGKGAALRAGMETSTAASLLFTDADFPYTMDSMLAVANAVEGGADVALGHRKSEYYASVPWFRKGLSELFRFVLRSLLRFPITDTQCGLKGMNHKGRQVFLNTRIQRFLVDMEFIKLAVRANCNVQLVVVQLRPDVVFSKMGPTVLMRELINFIRVIFR